MFYPPSYRYEYADIGCIVFVYKIVWFFLQKMADQQVSTIKEKKAPLFPEELTYDNLLTYIDNNIRSVQLGVYSIALCGFVIAVRSVRPFKKFKYPHEIPKSFFKKHVELNGNVMRIDFNPKPVLLVDHHPLLLSAIRRPGQGLKVGVEGIDLMPNGISWLQTIIVGQHIKFTLISQEKEYVTSIVEYGKKDVANQLVTLGFASVATFNQNLDSDKLYSKYYKSLLKQESKAESKRIGMWNDVPFSILKFILSKLSSSLSRLKPKSLKLN